MNIVSEAFTPVEKKKQKFLLFFIYLGAEKMWKFNILQGGHKKITKIAQKSEVVLN